MLKYEEHVKCSFINALFKRGMSIRDALDAIRTLVEIINDYDELSGKQKKELLTRVLKDICAGPDGSMYTQDDLVPANIIDGIHILIETNMISSVIDLICEVVHVRMGKSIRNLIYNCFCCMSACCQMRKPEILIRQPFL